MGCFLGGVFSGRGVFWVWCFLGGVFSGWVFFWLGCFLGRVFSGWGFFLVGCFLGGFFSGWGVSGWGVFWVGCFLGVVFPGWGVCQPVTYRCWVRYCTARSSLSPSSPWLLTSWPVVTAPTNQLISPATSSAGADPAVRWGASPSLCRMRPVGGRADARTGRRAVARCTCPAPRRRSRHGWSHAWPHASSGRQGWGRCRPLLGAARRTATSGSRQIYICGGMPVGGGGGGDDGGGGGDGSSVTLDGG